MEKLKTVTSTFDGKNKVRVNLTFRNNDVIVVVLLLPRSYARGGLWPPYVVLSRHILNTVVFKRAYLILKDCHTCIVLFEIIKGIGN